MLAAQEVAAAVNAAMEALPEITPGRHLREIEGLSYEEISVAMSCPIGTVRSRIFRAREAISAGSSRCWRSRPANGGSERAQIACNGR